MPHNFSSRRPTPAADVQRRLLELDRARAQSNNAQDAWTPLREDEEADQRSALIEGLDPNSWSLLKEVKTASSVDDEMLKRSNFSLVGGREARKKGGKASSYQSSLVENPKAKATVTLVESEQGKTLSFRPVKAPQRVLTVELPGQSVGGAESDSQATYSFKNSRTGKTVEGPLSVLPMSEFYPSSTIDPSAASDSAAPGST